MDGGADSGQVRLAVVEVLDRDGHARQVVPVFRWPVVVGRAVDCDVVLDDPFVAAHHATLEELNGVVGLHVGESLNGAEVSNHHVKASDRANLFAGDVVQLGATRLRVRLASEAVEPERRLLSEPAPGFLVLAGLLVGLAAWSMAERWISSDPGGRVIDYLPTLLGPFLALGVWCGFWALGSRLFRHRFDYWRHVRIAASYSLALSVVGLLLPVMAYALGWAFPSRIDSIMVAAIGWAMVLAHLTLVLPSRRRFLTIGMSVLFIAGVALFLTRNYQVNHRFFNELYVTTLAPPVLRVATPVTTSRFIDEARELKAALDARVHDDDNASASFSDDE